MRDIEAGVRQLIRRRPLEVVQVALPSGNSVRVPTFDEILRIKGYLIVRRNQTRDFLDVVALAAKMGVTAAATYLSGKVAPSSTLLIRMENVVERLEKQPIP